MPESVSESHMPQLTEASLNSAAESAVQAFEVADSLDSLADARRMHLGDDAPLSLARRALGSLPKDQRKDAGRLVKSGLLRSRRHWRQSAMPRCCA